MALPTFNALTSLPTYLYIGIPKDLRQEAPTNMTHIALQRLSPIYAQVSQSLDPPLNDEEATLLVTGSLEASTVTKLALLSRQLEDTAAHYNEHSTQPSLDKKSVILNNFCSTLEELSRLNRIEWVRVQCLELSQMHASLYPSKAPYRNTDTKEGFGVLFAKTQRGHLCVNDSFRPVFRAVFLAAHSAM
jgi:hypothetical protein